MDRFLTDDELKFVPKEWLKRQLFYFSGNERLRGHYKLCTDNKGDCVEK